MLCLIQALRHKSVPLTSLTDHVNHLSLIKDPISTINRLRIAPHVLFKYLISLQLLFFDVFLGVVKGDIGHAFPALPDEFLQQKVIGRGLHVVPVSLHETLYLIHIEGVGIP